MAKINEQESPSINLIGNGTVIMGDIKSNGDIRIDGTVVGSIKANGKIVVGATGNIEGELDCINGDFSGTIKAKVNVKELLSLKASSKLTGDIVTNKLAIEPGAIFTGTCNMSKENTYKAPLNFSEKNETAKVKEPTT
ncbi:MAG: polymer-forming cytoskeletal protein [Bacteroidales bacterium]|nr:polymer-forming cytoskeletal protein [Bacteroidales bacterium]